MEFVRDGVMSSHSRVHRRRYSAPSFAALTCPSHPVWTDWRVVASPLLNQYPELHAALQDVVPEGLRQWKLLWASTGRYCAEDILWNTDSSLAYFPDYWNALLGDGWTNKSIAIARFADGVVAVMFPRSRRLTDALYDPNGTMIMSGVYISIQELDGAFVVLQEDARKRGTSPTSGPYEPRDITNEHFGVSEVEVLDFQE